MAPSKKNVLEVLKVLHAFFDTIDGAEEIENKFYAVENKVLDYLSQTQNLSQTKITTSRYRIKMTMHSIKLSKNLSFTFWAISMNSQLTRQ